MADVKRTTETAPKDTFYLVLHGEIAIFDGGEDISVYTPHIAEHVMMAGPWIGEARIPGGVTLKLTGVDKGGDTMKNHASQSLVFRGGTPCPLSSYYEIRVPRPQKIYPCSLRELDATSVTIYNPGVSIVLSDNNKYPPYIAQCTVFEYSIQDPSQLTLIPVLGPAPLFPPWSAGQNADNGSYSMHVWAESDSPEDILHAQDSFGLAAQVLGASAKLAAKPNSPAKFVDTPKYLDFEEISYSLAGRVQALRGITSPSKEASGKRGLPGFSNPVPSAHRKHLLDILFNDEYTCGNIAMIGDKS
jgi:hypothetical protein